VGVANAHEALEEDMSCLEEEEDADVDVDAELAAASQEAERDILVEACEEGTNTVCS
jgi:hypothetical protein